MAYRLQAFSDVGLQQAALELAIGEHEARVLPRLEKLWTYYRNALEPVGRGADPRRRNGSWYSQPQEIGLPARLTGRAPGGPKTDDRLPSAREIVIENDIAWRIHAMVDFLFAKPIRFVSTARDEKTRAAVESALDSVFEQSGGIALFTDMALLGHVFGHVDLLVRSLPARRARAEDPLEFIRRRAPVRVELIEPRRGIPVADPADYRRLNAFLIRFQREENEAQRPGFLRQIFPGADSPRRKRSDVLEIFSGDHHQLYEGGRLVLDGPIPWTGGRLPISHVQNVSQPFEYGGLSEVEPLIPLQDELNTRLSDRAYRLAMQSFRMYLMRGLGPPDSLSVGPGIMIATDDLHASVQEFGGDASSPSEEAHFEALRNALDKVSGVPPLATGVVQGRSAISRARWPCASRSWGCSPERRASRSVTGAGSPRPRD